MRVKQTARKSTGTRLHGPSPNSVSSSDAAQARLRNLLTTKRKSQTPQEDGPKQPVIGGKGKGKRISYSGYHQPVKTKPRHKPGQLALKEIKRLQNKWELLIPRAAFHRLVREVTQNLCRANHPDEIDYTLRFQTAALEALQESAECYLTRLFEDSYLCTVHAKRVTLFVSDIQLCRRLQRIPPR